MLRFPFYFFLPGRNKLELDKGAMVVVDEGLKERGYFVSCQSGEKKDIFYFVYSFPLTLVDREAGLFLHFLFHNPFICYNTRFFLLLYIY